MANATLVQNMLDNAVHIGHKREYWSPKMRDYIYGVQNGIHVFDLFKSAAKLEEAKAYIADATAKGKTILFVGTKVQTRDLVEAIAKSTGHFYVSSKWVPGLLTNFTTIKKRIAYYIQLSSDIDGGLVSGLTKKELSIKKTEFAKLEKAYVGVKDMKKLPDIVIAVDGFYEDLALTEAGNAKITRIALLGSTGDIDKAEYFVPSNVNSIKSIAFVLGEIGSAISMKKVDRAFGAKVEKIAPKGHVEMGV
jgi:small subunit ribosomal protein S2